MRYQSNRIKRIKRQRLVDAIIINSLLAVFTVAVVILSYTIAVGV